jgi:hypothetical protein
MHTSSCCHSRVVSKAHHNTHHASQVHSNIHRDGNHLHPTLLAVLSQHWNARRNQRFPLIIIARACWGNAHARSRPLSGGTNSARLDIVKAPPEKGTIAHHLQGLLLYLRLPVRFKVFMVASPIAVPRLGSLRMCCG